MTYVVNETCSTTICHDNPCTSVCPVECINIKDGKALITDECIDCDVCVPECPLNAISAPKD